MTHVDLFSGIGGFALAAGWAGFTTVQFVEIDPYCQAVLRKHWPEVPIHDDIKTFKWPMADSAIQNARGGTGLTKGEEFVNRKSTQLLSHSGGRAGRTGGRNKMPISDRLKGYADFGWANGWRKVPAEVVRCRDLGHRPSDTDVGPAYRGLEHVIVCDVCRIVYRVDSSD